MAPVGMGSLHGQLVTLHHGGVDQAGLHGQQHKTGIHAMAGLARGREAHFRCLGFGHAIGGGESL